MATDTFEDTKEGALRFAYDANNPALYRAISYCRTFEDLAITVRQAHGVGSERFQDAFRWVTERYEDHN